MTCLQIYWAGSVLVKYPYDQWMNFKLETQGRYFLMGYSMSFGYFSVQFSLQFGRIWNVKEIHLLLMNLSFSYKSIDAWFYGQSLAFEYSFFCILAHLKMTPDLIWIIPCIECMTLSAVFYNIHTPDIYTFKALNSNHDCFPVASAIVISIIGHS